MNCLVAQSPYLRVVSTLPSPHAHRKFLCSLLPLTLPPLLSPWEGPPCFLCGSLLFLLSLPWSQCVGSLMYDQAMFLFKNKKQSNAFVSTVKQNFSVQQSRIVPYLALLPFSWSTMWYGSPQSLVTLTEGVYLHTPLGLCVTSPHASELRWDDTFSM